jgi:hypothetical protein
LTVIFFQRPLLFFVFYSTIARASFKKKVKDSSLNMYLSQKCEWMLITVLHLTVPSIKPSLHYFQVCLVGLSLGILIFSILSPHQRCLCRVETIKSRPVHSIRELIFPILKDRSAKHYCCTCGNLVISVRLFSCWVVPVFLTWVQLNHPKDMWPAF